MDKHTHSVAIFWDYENCPVPSGTPGWEVVKEVLQIAQAYGSIKVFKAYLELPAHSGSPRSLQLRSELQASGVSLTDCPHNGRKDVADKMMLVDMMAHAIDNPAPWTFVLISGDRDFAYAISVLRLRRYQIILFSPPTAHISLKSQATNCLDWSSILKSLTSTRILPEQGKDAAFVFQHTVKVTQNPHNVRDSHLRDDKSSRSGLDIAEYLRGSRRYRRLSISSDVSRSTVSESLDNASTAYSITQEEPVKFSLPLPNQETRYNANLDSSVSTNRKQIQHSSPIQNGSASAIPTFGTAGRPSPSISAQVSTGGQTPPTRSLATIVSATGPIQPPAPTLPSPKLPVPENFQTLVSLLREYRSSGFGRPSRFDIARVLNNHSYVYSQAGVDRFDRYIALAEGDKIVTQGGDWVALRPEWF